MYGGQQRQQHRFYLCASLLDVQQMTKHVNNVANSHEPTQSDIESQLDELKQHISNCCALNQSQLAQTIAR